jgi:hypothetical protein
MPRSHVPTKQVRRQPDRRADGLYSVHGVAAHFGVTDGIVRYWIDKCWLTAVEGGGGGRPCWFKLDRATIKRLETAKARGYGSGRRKRRDHSETSLQDRGHYA